MLCVSYRDKDYSLVYLHGVSLPNGPQLLYKPQLQLCAGLCFSTIKVLSLCSESSNECKALQNIPLGQKAQPA